MMSARTHSYSRCGSLALAITAFVAMVACEQGGVAVVSSRNGGAYGRSELVAAIEAFAHSDRSPGKFRDLATTVEALRPRFNDVVAAEAERHLVMLALTPLEAHYGKTPDERLQVLGTTVWPFALGVQPAPDESPASYAERVCSSQLALECKYVVPEYRALMLSALIWRRLRDRARDAVQACDSCRTQTPYQKTLDAYERHERDVADIAHHAEQWATPSRWPVAGDRALAWSDAPLFEVRKSDAHRFRGEPLAAGEVLTNLLAARQDHEVLGLFIRASAPVSELRMALREARAAGFSEVALQVRSPIYPYALSEYRLFTDPGSVTISVRDIDTVQILVQALDAASQNGSRAHRI